MNIFSRGSIFAKRKDTLTNPTSRLKTLTNPPRNFNQLISFQRSSYLFYLSPPFLLHIFSFAGLLLSIYALHVEKRASEASSLIDAKPYRASCDISARISCSAVFTSEYGHIFSKTMPSLIPVGSALDLPNAAYGFIFYCTMIAGGLVRDCLSDSFFRPSIQVLLTFLSIASLVITVYLACILAFVMKLMCLVCMGTYACNLLIFASILSTPRNRSMYMMRKPPAKKPHIDPVSEVLDMHEDIERDREYEQSIVYTLAGKIKES